jgi:hypothetical protein
MLRNDMWCMHATCRASKQGGQRTLDGGSLAAQFKPRGNHDASSSAALEAAAAGSMKRWPVHSPSELRENQQAIADMLYGCNLPLCLPEHPDFKAMIHKLAPYMDQHLPSRKALSTRLLDNAYQETRGAVSSWLANQVSWAVRHAISMFNCQRCVRSQTSTNTTSMHVCRTIWSSAVTRGHPHKVGPMC